MKARGVHRRNQAGFFHRRDVTGREIVRAGYSKHSPHLRRASRTVCENRQHVPCDPAATAIQDTRYHVGQRVLHFSPAASFHDLKPFGGDGKPVPPVAADCLLSLGILLQFLDRQAYGRLMKGLRPWPLYRGEGVYEPVALLASHVAGARGGEAAPSVPVRPTSPTRPLQGSCRCSPPPS